MIMYLTPARIASIVKENLLLAASRYDPKYLVLSGEALKPEQCLSVLQTTVITTYKDGIPHFQIEDVPLEGDNPPLLIDAHFFAEIIVTDIVPFSAGATPDFTPYIFDDQGHVKWHTVQDAVDAVIAYEKAARIANGMQSNDTIPPERTHIQDVFLFTEPDEHHK
jgi:hypothetical protein